MSDHEIQIVTTSLADIPPEQRIQLLEMLFVSVCGNFAQEADTDVREKLLQTIRGKMPPPINASQSVQHEAFNKVLNIFEEMWRDMDVMR